MLEFNLIWLCEFLCGHYVVDVHISVAEADPALNENSALRDDDMTDDVIFQPETKTYVELTAFFFLMSISHECYFEVYYIKKTTRTNVS